MNILVTGSAGFIGMNLCWDLLEAGHKVIGYDNFSHDYNLFERQTAAFHVGDYENYSFKRALTFNKADIFQFEDIEIIYALGAIPGINPSWTEYKRYYHHNIYGFNWLLDKAVEAKTKPRVVLASSSSIYEELAHASYDDAPFISLDNPYALSKFAQEKICKMYWDSYEIPFVTGRLFGVYGIFQRPDLFIYSAINAAINETDITIYGNIDKQRDFTYVDDVTDGLKTIAENGKVGEAYNICSGIPYSLEQTMEMICNITGKSINTLESPQHKGDKHRTWGNNSKLLALGWKPKFDLEAGLKAQIEWQENLNEGR